MRMTASAVTGGNGRLLWQGIDLSSPCESSTGVESVQPWEGEWEVLARRVPLGSLPGFRRPLKSGKTTDDDKTDLLARHILSLGHNPNSICTLRKTHTKRQIVVNGRAFVLCKNKIYDK